MDLPILSCTLIPRKSLEKSSTWPAIRTRAEITFANHKGALDAEMLNGVTIGNMKLQVGPSKQQTICKPLDL